MKGSAKQNPGPALSVIIPLMDAERGLQGFWDELYPFLNSLNRSYEVVFVDQGSLDRTSTLLYQQHKLWPELTQVLLAHGRVSEDTAVLAGLKACRGKAAIILPFRTGAPSKVIAQFLDSLDLGHDFVAGATSRSEGSGWHRRLFQAETWLRTRVSGFRLSDPDFGLYGYDRSLITTLNQAGVGPLPVPEVLPALALSLALNPEEIAVPDMPKPARKSPSGRIDQAYRHLHLLFGASRLPLRLYAVLSLGLALLAFALALFVALFGLLVADAGVGGILLGLVLASHLALGLGLFALYLDRLPGGLGGDAGFQLKLHLAPRVNLEGAATVANHRG